MTTILDARARAMLLSCLALVLSAACTRPTPSYTAAPAPGPGMESGSLEGEAPAGSSADADSASEPQAESAETSIEAIPPEAIRIELETAGSSAIVTGSVEAEGERIYVLSAQAGQQMQVGLEAEPTAAVIDDYPDGCQDCVAFEIAAWEDWDWRQAGISAWAGTLPVDGDYYFRVFSILAPYDKDFRLEISISEDPDAAYNESGGG